MLLPRRSLLAFFLGLGSVLLATLPMSAHEIPMYIGTYTKPNASQGIYYATLDSETGAISEPALAVKSGSPSFLVLHPSKPFLYAVNEAGGGSVSSFAIEAPGKLREVNRQPSLGGGPTHISIDRDGKNVLVANYGGGSVAVLPIAEDGSLKEAVGFVQHSGSGPNAARQKGPHAHSIYVDRANTHAYACDLGLDKLLVYRFNAAQSTLEPTDPAFAVTDPGAGPRHLAFGPEDNFVYCVSEMANTVTVFARESGKAVLNSIQTITTLPVDFNGKSSIAEVMIHPNAKFLYASNRGHDSIAVFSIDAEGKLTPLGHTPTLGKHPRFFGLDPSGKFLLACNMETNTIVPFRIDEATGLLSPVAQPVACFAPACLVFSKQ